MVFLPYAKTCVRHHSSSFIHKKVRSMYISRAMESVNFVLTSLPTHSTATPDMASPGTSGGHLSKFKKRLKMLPPTALCQILVLPGPTSWWAPCLSRSVDHLFAKAGVSILHSAIINVFRLCYLLKSDFFSINLETTHTSNFKFYRTLRFWSSPWSDYHAFPV